MPNNRLYVKFVVIFPSDSLFNTISFLQVIFVFFFRKCWYYYKKLQNKINSG